MTARPLDHNDETIVFAEATEARHRNFLAEFEEKVWPMYADYGYPKPTAILLWMLHRLDCGQDRIIELLEQEARSATDDWQEGADDEC